jgi:hypothetical protein
MSSNKVNVSTKEFSSACIMRCKVEENGYCGGDAGHGSFVDILIKDIAGTFIEASFNEEKKELHLIVRGACERDVLRDVLNFIVLTLDGTNDYKTINYDVTNYE